MPLTFTTAKVAPLDSIELFHPTICVNNEGPSNQIISVHITTLPNPNRVDQTSI